MSGAVKGWWRQRHSSSVERWRCVRYLKAVMDMIGAVIPLKRGVASARTYLVP
ncbi:MAG: hypothetical protein ACI8WM_001678 [Burkholderiaceae bacterium]|jgi:hypothetical protein